jgi:hypothetical protein
LSETPRPLPNEETLEAQRPSFEMRPLPYWRFLSAELLSASRPKTLIFEPKRRLREPGRLLAIDIDLL